MYKLSGSEKVIDLEGIPLSDSGAPQPQLIVKEGSVSLSYLAADNVEIRVEVNFTGPVIHIFGTPNDETLKYHPLFAVGLKHYAISEVLNSGWVDDLEQANSVHPQHDAEKYESLHHYVFAFHDSTFECVARGLAVS